jgi:hypothetical protein
MLLRRGRSRRLEPTCLGTSRVRGASARRRSVCGRGEDLERLEALLFPSIGTRRPVVVSGMAGVGKSYFCRSVLLGPPGQIPRRISAAVARSPRSWFRASELIAQTGRSAETAGRRRRGAADATAGRAGPCPYRKCGIRRGRGCYPRADTRSARMRDRHQRAPRRSRRECPLGTDRTQPFDAATALQQLAEELGPDAPGQKDWPVSSSRSAFCRWRCI